jgi:hypothetical protein
MQTKAPNHNNDGSLNATSRWLGRVKRALLWTATLCTVSLAVLAGSSQATPPYRVAGIVPGAQHTLTIQTNGKTPEVTSNPAYRAAVACAQRLTHNSALTLTTAERCAPGVPVFSASSPPATYPGPLFIVVRSTGSVALETSHRASPLASGARAASCYNTWRNPSASFFWGWAWGGINAYGYGNHCGYANVPNDPSVYHGCACSGYQQSIGHYDSNYGRAHFGQNYAAGWANMTYSLAFAQDTWFCRVFVDPNANSWGWCS